MAEGDAAPTQAPRFVIEPGNEAAVAQMLAPFLDGAEVAPGWVVTAVSIDRDRIVLTLGGPADAVGELALVHPSAAPESPRSAHFAVVTEVPELAVVSDRIATTIHDGTLDALWSDAGGRAAIVEAESRVEFARTDADLVVAREQGPPPPEPVVLERPPGAPLVAVAVLLAVVFGKFLTARRDWPRTRPGRFGFGAAMLVLATFALAELMLCVTGALPPEPAVSPDVDRVAVENAINPLGLREPWETVPARQPGEVRVAFLGDSFTYGEGVEREENFAVGFEERANAALSDGSVRVFNLGVMDNDTAQEAERYRRLHEQLDADVLVLVAYLNDFTGGDPAYLLEDIYGVGYAPGLLARESRLVAHLNTTVRNRLVRRRAIAFYRSATVREARVLEEGGLAAMDEITALRDFAEERGVEFRLVLFPWLFELNRYPVQEFHRAFGAFAADASIPFLDLLTIYEGLDADELRVSPANEHPSAYAHGLAADALFEFLEEDLRRLAGE